MITIEAMGLEKAQALGDFLIAAIAEYSGCFYRGATREDGQATNGEIVTHLAAGGRNLRPLSPEAARKLGDIWKAEVEKAAQSFLNSQGEMKAAYARKESWERAKIASARAWRAAGQAVLAIMDRRRKQQLTASDGGAESTAKHVGDDYAEQRKRKYGVSEDKVYVATGQLMEDLSPDAEGRITLVKGAGASGR